MSDIRYEILGCSEKTRRIIDLIRAERQTVANRPGLPAIVEADCAYLDFFIDLFDEAARELDAIDAEIAIAVAGGHADRLRRIAGRATEGRRRCLEFFDSISLEISEQLSALQDLNGLADRIEPRAPAAIDRRALFTRFFRWPRERS